ncbi:hypothetical protein DUNSADRAFT_13998 [Dunaliella salina]|uniref:Uncharacterized protein n=1 Tax=Dunaliella salina TaxID=3046 RepID=A0ABQ7G8B8_DUNSA|nr:hypothetical protein DUNSADRAFT_13998 [Dunaliella salina]|eukprot:KAF5830808.1 hypothetical protein DUNSADRAFT_13998 [Dunaliella salina]
MKTMTHVHELAEYLNGTFCSSSTFGTYFVMNDGRSICTNSKIRELCRDGMVKAVLLWNGAERALASVAERVAQSFLLKMHPGLTTNLMAGNGSSTLGHEMYWYGSF